MGAEGVPVHIGQRVLYGGLVCVRLCMVFAPGYIHPDEFFQSNEVTAAEVFSLRTVLPWEFTDPGAPARSIVTPYLSSGVAFVLARAVQRLSGLEQLTLSSSGLLTLSRALPFCLSFCVDAAVWCACVHTHRDPMEHLLVLASSWPMLVFMTRPFSNTLEAALLAVAFLVCFPLPSSPLPRASTSQTSAAKPPSRQHEQPPTSTMTCEDSHPISLRRAALLGALTALGVFVRFTYVFCVAPLLIAVVSQHRQLLWRGAALGAAFTAAAALVVTGIVHLDSWYFSKDLCAAVIATGLQGECEWTAGGGIVVTPWNNLRYNLQKKNLAHHGLHPWWLHAFVNLPMLFGPLVVHVGKMAVTQVGKAFGRAEQQRTANSAQVCAKAQQSSTPPCLHKGVVEGALWGTLLLPLAGLSLAPHQEPRFLLPVLLPVSFIGAASVRIRLTKILWVLFNLAAVVLFGIVHQGGIIPAMAYLERHSQQSGSATSSQLVFARTYMPPQSLLLNSAAHPWAQVHDLAGTTPSKLIGYVQTLQRSCSDSLRCDDAPIYLVIPASTVATHVQARHGHRGHCLHLELLMSLGPHFSGEETEELVSAWVEGGAYMLWKALHLNVYRIGPIGNNTHYGVKPPMNAWCTNV